MKRIVVCDTGPLLHLSEAGAVHLLAEMGNVYVPPLVAVEFKVNSQGWNLPHWVTEVGLDRHIREKAESWVQTNQVDGGEAEAIGLVLQIRANWLLTDDAKARQFAESLGLEVHGSVGVLLWNVATGHIDDKRTAHQLLNDLAKSSLWVSERVVNAARKAIDSLFD
ncbi:MAG: hypothetical protein IPG44_17630 [Anaerolineales bacterium]|jgi:predicted nucleic acid-binding protein|nr:hypothetical protein [Chloroflexota bacterium]MBK6647536.1 hypothetical protein [Anaerolineales bacterium]